MNSMHISPLVAPEAGSVPVCVFRHAAMGTEFCLYLESAREADARSLSEEIFAEIDRVGATFSRFDPASEISRLNRHAAAGTVVTDPEVFRVLAEARALWKKTVGVFDPALGRLSRAWGFAERAPHLPTSDEAAVAQAASGMVLVELDPEWRTVHFLDPGVELDLGAFAKGYAVDCSLNLLRQNGASGLLDAGRSSMAAVGESFAQDWRVAINLPEAEAFGAPKVGQPQLLSGPVRILAEVRLGSQALATSGIMEQKFIENGRIYAHLLDPRKQAGKLIADCGTPERARVQCTVLAPTAALADALSTALFLLGPEEGREILERFQGCAALWIFTESGQMRWKTCQWPQEAFCSLETMQ